MALFSPANRGPRAEEDAEDAVDAGLSPSLPTAPPRRGETRAATRLSTAERDARSFLTTTSATWAAVSAVSARAEWAAASDATSEHLAAREAARQALAAFTGTPALISRVRALLARKDELGAMTVRQLQALQLAAAEAPGTIPDVVHARDEAEARQEAIRADHLFCLTTKGKRCVRFVSGARLETLRLASKDVAERARLWSLGQSLGRELRPGLRELRDQRNEVARAVGMPSFFALKVAGDAMTTSEMMGLLDQTLDATHPLYDQLHCLARIRLAARYGRPFPRDLPAPWLVDGDGLHWHGLVAVTPLESLFAGASPEPLVKSADAFFVSLGLPRLPATFWQTSDLYRPKPEDPRRKLDRPSAWHVDLEQDVRVLMNVSPHAAWFARAHHELAHVQYFLAYARDDVPPLLRRGANRAFHEALAELAELASEQPPYLARTGVVPPGLALASPEALLSRAFETLVPLRFAAGAVSHFERDLYEGNLAVEEWQPRWWDYLSLYQGVVPPGPRDADLCDPCAVPLLMEAPAQAYDRVLATLTAFQLHEHICTQILHQDPHACDYGGHREVGDFLRTLMSAGATRNWRQMLEEATGEPLSARALITFFAPLTEELARQTAGASCVR